MAFTCQICFDTKSKRLQLPHLATGNGDVLRSADCQHPICLDCMARYVGVRVEEQRAFQLRCPMEGCSNELFEKDVRRLVEEGVMSGDVLIRFAALRARDFNARSKSFDLLIPQSDDDLNFVLALREMRLCPRCKLVIQRSAGCNSFFCICGEKFNYAKAERPVGHNFAKFRWTCQLARSRGVSLEEAASYGGDIRLFKKADLIASQLGVSRDDARDLHKRAQEGDVDAQEKIRSRRCSQHRERRFAKDGVAYTLEQFQSYYRTSWVQHWKEAGTMILRRLQERSPRTKEETEDALDGSHFEVKVLGAWLPLVQVLACDFGIPKSEKLLVQGELMSGASSPNVIPSRRSLRRWNLTSRSSACGSAHALRCKHSLGCRGA